MKRFLKSLFLMTALIIIILVMTTGIYLIGYANTLTDEMDSTESLLLECAEQLEKTQQAVDKLEEENAILRTLVDTIETSVKIDTNRMLFLEGGYPFHIGGSFGWFPQNSFIGGIIGVSYYFPTTLYNKGTLGGSLAIGGRF